MSSQLTNSVTIIPTGVANIASICAALKRLGIDPRLASSASDVLNASSVILPGVGSFASGMNNLFRLGFIAPLRERLAARQATMAICLGLQLLFQGSEESPESEGLGYYSGRVRRLQNAPRLPQMGWNRVVPAGDDGVIKPGYAYFAHSYCAVEAPVGVTPSFANYGERFVAAIEDGPLLACQFHPELSASWGNALISRWLATAAEDYR